ncbi:hypothetical protein ACFMQL_31660 [Nonomuraea fastidiosa]|jgi:hypothetical protein|uniref:hypothetical protein n=1 Tax=Nonomuraea TaxID=83681 RepID=UPI00324467F5
MANKMGIACALLAGYYLGRRRKLRTAAFLAAAGLAGKASGNGGLLSLGLKALGSSADIGKLTEQVKGGLLEAGKAAASRQVDSLSDKLHERAEQLKTPATAEGGDEPTEGADQPAEGADGTGPTDESSSDGEPESDTGDEAGDQDETEREPAGQERARRQPRTIRRTSVRR